MPEDDSYADRDIQRVLRAELRNLETEIRCIYDILSYSGNLVAEYDGIFPSRFRLECIKHHGTYCLFCTDDRIPFLLETADGVHGVVHMFPDHAVLRTESRLMNLGRRWYGTYSAQPDLVDLE